MKPIGSITNTLPFIESKYIPDIEALIDKSINYADFSEKLCEYVLSNDVSDQLAYIALYHANRVNYYQKQTEIVTKFSDSPIFRPLHVIDESSSGIELDWSRILEEVDHAIFCTDNLFIRIDLYVTKWMATIATNPSSLDEERIVQRIQDLIDNNTEIKFLQSIIHDIKADRETRENRYSDALDSYRLAYEEAIKYDDIDFIGEIKIAEAYILARICDPRALETINHAKRIWYEMGYLDRRYGWINITAVVHDTRGEYNRACELYLEGLSNREKIYPDSSLRLFPQALSRIFRRMDQQNESIEWAKTGLESKAAFAYWHTHGRQALANICLASSYALQRKIEDASSHLEKASKLIIESGAELWLSDMYLCHGFIERAEGNLLDAMSYFERAYDIVSRMQRQDRINEALFRLAETEILLHADDIEELFKENIKSWNQRLEEMARTKELPGILGLAYFLKTQILMYQNKTEEAKKYFLLVCDQSKKPETRYLENYIKKLALYQDVCDTTV